MHVDTVFVISSARGAYGLADSADAIYWSSKSRVLTLLVDESGQGIGREAMSRRWMATSLPATARSGFHCAAALQTAMAAGLEFKIAVFLSDVCMVIGEQLDEFLLAQMLQSSAGVMGVRTFFNDPQTIFQAALPFLYEWGVPHDRYERAPVGLSDEVIVLSYATAENWAQRRLLPPVGCERWPAGFGSFASWVAQMYGLPVLAWGSTEKVLPPLYVCDRQAPSQPPPHILSPRFLLYSSARNVLGYSEADLRELYKGMRGEEMRPVASFGPQLILPEAAV